MQNQLPKSKKTCTFSKFFWKSIEKVQVFLLFGSWFCIYAVFYKLKSTFSWNPFFFIVSGKSPAEGEGPQLTCQAASSGSSQLVRLPRVPVRWPGSPVSQLGSRGCTRARWLVESIHPHGERVSNYLLMLFVLYACKRIHIKFPSLKNAGPTATYTYIYIYI